MIVRAIDGAGDWLYGSGRANYLSMNRAIGQNIQTRVLEFLGDCFFATNRGIDWFNLLGGKNSKAIETAVGAVIINTDGVTALNEISAQLNGARSFSLSYSVTTIYTGLIVPRGTINSSGNFLLTESGDVLITEDGNPITI
jgi:hypothetical protein